jgi:hypothetical protein
MQPKCSLQRGRIDTSQDKPQTCVGRRIRQRICRYELAPASSWLRSFLAITALQQPAAETGLPQFQRDPCLCNVAVDPGGVEEPCDGGSWHIWPSTDVTVSTSAISRITLLIPTPRRLTAYTSAAPLADAPATLAIGRLARSYAYGTFPLRIALTSPDAWRLRRRRKSQMVPDLQLTKGAQRDSSQTHRHRVGSSL